MNNDFILIMAQKQVNKLAWQILWKEKAILRKEINLLERQKNKYNKEKKEYLKKADKLQELIVKTNKLEKILNENLEKIYSWQEFKEKIWILKWHINSWRSFSKQAEEEKEKYRKINPIVKEEMERIWFDNLWVSWPNWPWLEPVPFTVKTIVSKVN